VTQDAKETENLSPAVIVTVGPEAAAVGQLLAARYPTDTLSLSVEQAGSAKIDFAGLIKKINKSARHTDAVTELPAVVVIADIADSDAVLRVLDAIRSGKTMVKPRVWPAFVTGVPTELGAFDSALDERGTGSCDLVLIMTGAASQQASADALAAWLHVKMPAPASVLAELPDSQGRICRYVALGCRAVDPARRRVGTSGAQTAISLDVAKAAVRINAELAVRAQSDASVVAVAAAVAALTEAAQQYSAADLLRSESELTVALTGIDRNLVPALRSDLPQIVTEVVAQLSAESTAEPAAEAAATQAETVADSAPQELTGPTGDGADRTATVSQLVLLASKGGLTKMFSRNRMATVAETIGPLAQADVAATIRSALGQVQTDIPALVENEAKRLADLHTAELDAAARAAEQAESTTWNDAVDTARREVGLWPSVDVAGISRSWGGGVPAARQYVVGSASALRLLADDDAFMPIVDLRTQEYVAAADGDEIDLRDHANHSVRKATVLLAQYGLPLAALK
jgi:hypothetical protein